MLNCPAMTEETVKKLVGTVIVSVLRLVTVKLRVVIAKMKLTMKLRVCLDSGGGLILCCIVHHPSSTQNDKLGMSCSIPAICSHKPHDTCVCKAC